MARCSAARCGQIAAAASVPATTIASCVSTIVSSTSSRSACAPSSAAGRGTVLIRPPRCRRGEGPGETPAMTTSRAWPDRSHVGPVETHVLQRLPRVLEHRAVRVAVAEGPRDAERRPVVDDGRADRRVGPQRAEGEREHGGPHLLAEPSPPCRGDEPRRGVDGAVGAPVRPLEPLGAHDLASRTHDEGQRPVVGRPQAQGAPVALREDRPAVRARRRGRHTSSRAGSSRGRRAGATRGSAGRPRS